MVEGLVFFGIVLGRGRIGVSGDDALAAVFGKAKAAVRIPAVVVVEPGSTGYNHCVTMGRSRSVDGPYEGDPKNPIVTSAPNESNERADADHLKPRYFNPDSVLQKSGHGSYVITPGGKTYLVHLTSRPFVPELRCTLGRETAIQKMCWTDDGWLRMADGSNLAKTEVEEPNLPDCPLPVPAPLNDFDEPALRRGWYAPRIAPETFIDLASRPGYLRMRGQEAQTSLNRASILCRKLTSLHTQVTAKMDFHPEIWQHSAGLILYYDNMNYLYLRKYYSQTLGQSALSLIYLENGEKKEVPGTRTPVGEGELWLRLTVEERSTGFAWSADGENYAPIGPVFDTSKFSDEYCKFGEFTGTMVGITCTDGVLRRKTADFDFFEMRR